MRRVSDSVKASFLRDLADLLDRHPWAQLTYTNADDGIHLKEEANYKDDIVLGCGDSISHNARAEAKRLSETSK